MATGNECSNSDLQTEVVCESCDSNNDGSSYCIQCHAYICNECKSSHCNARLTRDHIILHRSHPEVLKARRSKKIYCSQHKGKEYITYCTRCSLPCCATCITDNHDGHRFTDLDDMVSKTESEVHDLVQYIETDFVPFTEKALSSLKEQIGSYKRALYRVKQSGTDRIQHLKQQLVEAEATFLAYVDEHGNEDLNNLESIKRDLSKELKQIKLLVAKGKVVPLDASLLLLKETLFDTNSLRPDQKSCPENMSLCESKFLFPSPVHVIGSIKRGGRKRLTDETVAKIESDHKKISKVIKTIDIREGTSVICFIDEFWVFNDSCECIEIFSKTFSKIKSMNLGFQLDDMARYGLHEVIVTKWIDFSVVRISNSGSITKLFNTTPLTPCGICFNNKEEIVVGVEGYEEDEIKYRSWKLLIRSSDGSTTLKEIQYDQDRQEIFKGPITRVRQMACGEYVATAGSSVVCLTVDWKVKWTHEFGPIYKVSALYCDKNNNIVVGDTDNNRIIVLDKDGQLIRTLLTSEDGVCFPKSLDVDWDGRLWIGQEKNVIISSFIL